MAQTRLKSGNLHMIGGDNGSDGNVLKSKGDGTMEWGTIIVNPTFSSFDYPGDDTALDPAGGQSLVINGTGFNPSVTVTIGGTTCSSITRNSSEQLTVTTPAKSAGSQAVVITNTDGGSANTNVSYNGIPAFTNAAGSLGSFKTDESINLSAAATEPDGGAITYAITSGALPSGVTLNTSTGAITGTAPSVSADTTSNFTVTATDDENQSTARAYSITVTPPLPSDDFSVVTYTGNGGTQAITSVGFQPDMIWIKERSGADAPRLLDSTRGVNSRLFPSETNAASVISGTLNSFDTNGFTLGSAPEVNQNGETYVAWCWKANGGTTSSNTDGSITSTVQANQDAGFSVVTWTGTGAQGTIGHGLSAAPEVILSKRLDGSQNWTVYQKDLGLSHTTYPNWLYLNFTSEEQNSVSSANHPYYQAPSSTLIYQNTGTSENSNVNGAQYVSYCFASVASYSSTGSYTGNGSTNGPIVETGFEPAFVMIKETSQANHWNIYDNKRTTTNPRDKQLQANLSDAESTNTSIQVDFLSNGFQCKGSGGGLNRNNSNYIYMAFAEDPDTTAPTLADSFNVKTYTGNGSTQSIEGLGFQPNLVWIKERNSTSSHSLADSVRGVGNIIQSDLTNAEVYSLANLTTFDSDGFTIGASNGVNESGKTYAAWAWKADDNEPTIYGGDAETIYKFEDNINDVTGKNNGGSSNVTYTTGKFNKAASFNGTTSYAYSSSTFSGINSSQFSVSCWVKFDTIGTNENIIMGRYTYTNSDQQFIIRISANGQWQLSKYFGNGGGEGLTTTETASTNTWYHVVSVYDNTKMSIYVDGVLLKTEVGAGVANASPTSKLHIGGYEALANNDSSRMDGLIDQIRIYNGVLGQTQVTELYNETASDNDDVILGGPPETIISANANSGFSIVKWTGNGSAGKIPHGLSAAPEMIITKRLTGTSPWYTYNAYLNGGVNPAYYFVNLNTNDAETNNGSSGGSLFNSTPPTSTIFNIGTSLSGSGDEYIAYCFHSVSNYSKMGSYTGNGSTTGPVITTGFQPDFVMIKSTSIAGAWMILDSARSPSNPRQLLLQPQSTAVEENVGNAIDFNANNFQLTDTNASRNQNGATYIYMAFKIN